MPYFLARMDNLYTEQAIGVHGRRFTGGAVPSDFFRQNCFLSFQEDAVGIQLRGLIGVESLLWGSDYPHAESTFPRSRAIVERLLKGVPAEGAGADRGRQYRQAVPLRRGALTTRVRDTAAHEVAEVHALLAPPTP